MGFQYDVKAAHVNASGVLVTGPTRIKGYQIKPGGTAGTIIIYDNASAGSGDIAVELDITVNTAVIATLIPGDGIRCVNGAYVTLPASAAITVFYG